MRSRILVYGSLFWLAASACSSLAFAAAPTLGTVVPASGTSTPYQQVIFTATYSDADGRANLRYTRLLINTTASEVNAVFASYDEDAQKLYLRDDANTTWLGGCAPGASTMIENSYGLLDCSKTSVTGSGVTLTIKWAITFKPTFLGTQRIYLYAQDAAAAFIGHVQKATRVVSIPAKVFLNSTQLSQLRTYLSVHLNYFLSADAISATSGLPLGAFKEGDRGRFGYSNPTEWGYALQAWIAAAETAKITKTVANTRIDKALTTIAALQNNPAQNYQKLFYPYYYVTDRAGVDLAAPNHDPNTQIPSIDNGFLYTSLVIVEGWATANNFTTLRDKAKTIKDQMKFRIFLTPDGQYLTHLVNAVNGQRSASKWDVYADEGGAMSWLAFLSGSVNFTEYQRLINAMMRPPRTWNGFTVNEAPWFNAMFAWGVRSWAGFPVATWETGLNNLYGSNSFAPAARAHVAYGPTLPIDYPAFSDAMTQGVVGRYTPPNISNTVPTDVPAHVTPHALFTPFLVGPDLTATTVAALMGKITTLGSDTGRYYHYGQDGHKPYGFEVTTSPTRNKLGYPGVESRYIYETLSHAYIALSIFHAVQIQAGKPTFVGFANRVPGYWAKAEQAVKFLYPGNRVLRVPSAYPTIQAAVDAALPGDTVEVAAGRFVENVVITKPSITLRGVIGNAASPLATSNTVIDANGNGSLGIYLNKAVGTRVQSLVVTGANREFYTTLGGGILAELSDDAKIERCILYKNRAAYGAGVCVRKSKRMAIVENIFQENDGHWGGAIDVGMGAAVLAERVTIADNRILNNLAWESGAGIRVDIAQVSIVRNRIYGNVSDWAGGLYLRSASGEMTNNLVINNEADYRSGGGIETVNSSLVITNNVFDKNRAKFDWGGVGGGLHLTGTVKPPFKNNIVAANINDGIACDNRTGAALTYNDVYLNGPANYVVCIAGLGSISADPQFVAPDADGNPDNDNYRLKAGSLAVNAGDPAAAFNDRDSTRNDLGAYGGPNSL